VVAQNLDSDRHDGAKNRNKGDEPHREPVALKKSRFVIIVIP
jgi:hypothetical protein